MRTLASSLIQWSRAKRKHLTRVFHERLIDSLLGLGRASPPRSLSYKRAKSLHHAYPRRDTYNYDLQSKKDRATERFNSLSALSVPGPMRDVVELGAGDGQLALRFHEEGFNVRIIDTTDWRDEDVRTANIAFYQVQVNSPYPISDNSTDLFVSYGTFEHVADPAWVLSEIVRVTRPGGVVFLEFGPLYNSPWGLHAYRTFFAPYPQFLLTSDVLQEFIREHGVYDLGAERETFQYVNKWSFAAYRSLFHSFRNRVEIKRMTACPNYEGIGVIYRNLKCFRGRNLSFKELTTETLVVCLAVK